MTRSKEDMIHAKLAPSEGFDGSLESIVGPVTSGVEAAHQSRVITSKRIERFILSMARISVDTMMILSAIGFAYFIRFGFEPVIRAWPPKIIPPFGVTILPLIIGTPLLIGLLQMAGQYDVTRKARELDNLPKLVNAVCLFIVCLLIVSFLLAAPEVARGYTLIFGGVCIVALLFGRMVMSISTRLLRIPEVVVRNTLIVGAGDVGKAVALKLKRHPNLGLRPVGFVDSEPLYTEFAEPAIADLKVLGDTSQFAQLLEQYNVEKVIVAFSSDSHEELLNLTCLCNAHHVECGVVPRLFEIVTNENQVDEIGGIPLLNLGELRLRGTDHAIKASEDFLLGLMMLVLSLPLFAAIAIAIKLDTRGPVFFKQQRLGKNGKPFQLYKFRSMVNGAEELQEDIIQLNEAEGPLFKIREDPRITRTGRFIRRFSLDELPQVLNVLRGDMSLVGPRPPIPSEVDCYREWQRQRLGVKPGITGLWQVNGRSDLPYDEMVKFDLYYIERWSLWMDIKIIIRTVAAVLGGHGAY